MGLKEGLKANFSAKGLTDSRGFGRIRSSVRTSASDNDQTRIAAEQARLRLELEKQERLRAFKEKVGVGEEKRPSLGEPGTTTRHVVQLKDFEKKEGAGTVNKGKGKAQ